MSWLRHIHENTFYIYSNIANNKYLWEKQDGGKMTLYSHLHHIRFVLLQHLDGLGRFGVNDENTGVTSLSYQPLPPPTVKYKLNVSKEMKQSQLHNSTKCKRVEINQGRPQKVKVSWIFKDFLLCN